MKRTWPLFPLAFMAACSSPGTTTPIVPDGVIQLTPSISIPLEGVVAGVVVAAVIYFVYDPLAPNWKIREERLSEDTYRLDLRMKRYHTGGAGEAMQVLKRRAAVLKREQGYGDYQLIEFTEGIDSKTLGAQRVAEGTIKLVQRKAADAFQLNGR